MAARKTPRHILVTDIGGAHVKLQLDARGAILRFVSVINDAAMQAIGSYRGRRMLFLGLGTGLGATLILDGVVEPTELGHVPWRHGRTFEEYLGERGRRWLGTARWRRSGGMPVRLPGERAAAGR